jgi:crotonobetainyl-CoA:carnitine CoA-transferase CaiB-like acyl-CoA transferase
MGVLSGYRVIDSADEKGALCVQTLANMGADISHINPEKPAERDNIPGVLEKTDILVESFPPGYLGSLGLGYKELSRKNPRLIMASITHFGQNGPYRDYKSCDLVAEAMGGWLSVTGTSKAPLKLFGSQAYYTASLFTANGILLALWQRHATGRGQYLDISIVECVAATLDQALVRFFYEDIVSKRQGSRRGNNAFRVFPCKDGYILLSLLQHWETLVAWLESEGMEADLTDEKWRTREARIRGFDHIAKVLKNWTLTHTADELVEKGQLMHFPWAKVISPGVMSNDRER